METKNKIPQTRIIANDFETEIRNGTLPPGTRLPSVRELAMQKNIGISSAIGAYKLLEKRGLIVREAGRGTFVRSDGVIGADRAVLYGWNAIYKDYAPDFGVEGNSFPGLQYDTYRDYIDYLSEKNRQSPGAALVDDGLLPVLASEKVLQPLNGLVSESLLSKIPSQLLNAMSYQGQLYALPAAFSLPKLYYNRAIFRKENLPEPDNNWTWEDVITAMRQLTRITRNQRVERFGLGMIPDINGFMPFIFQSGGRLFDNNGNCTISELPFWNGLELFLRLYTSPGICMRQWGDPSGAVVELLIKNELAMLVGYSFEGEYLRRNDNPDHWGEIRLPGIQNNHCSTLLVNGIGVMSHCRNVKKWVQKGETLITGSSQSSYKNPVITSQLTDLDRLILQHGMVALQHPSRFAFAALHEHLLFPAFRKMTLTLPQIKMIEKKINQSLHTPS